MASLIWNRASCLFSKTEEDNTKNIVSHGVSLEKQTILEAEAVKAEAKKCAFKQGNFDDSHSALAREDKEEDATEKIATYGV